MKNILRLIYKIIWIISFKLENSIHTMSLRVRLWLCGFIVGNRILSQGKGGVDLRISRYSETLRIGNNVTFSNHNDAGWNSNCSIWVRENASLSIGNKTGFNGVLIYAANSVTIGNNVKVGGGTRIFDTDFHPLDFHERRIYGRTGKSAPIKIEDDVFIGAGCIILKGVTIGARSIVAAGSVVSRSIPSDEIWGGNPAKLIRKL